MDTCTEEAPNIHAELHAMNVIGIDFVRTSRIITTTYKCPFCNLVTAVSFDQNRGIVL